MRCAPAPSLPDGPHRRRPEQGRADFYQRLLDLELLLCEREPYWRTAQFWQLTARLDE